MSLRRSGLVSFILHGLALLALLITLPRPAPPPPPEVSVALEFVGPPAQRSPVRAPTPSPAPAPVPNPAPPTPETPRPQPVAPPPPPPPPPTATPAPATPTPPAAPSTPPPAPTPTPVPTPTPAPTPTPPTPRPPPPPPRPTPPMPTPTPVPTPPAPTSQPNPVRTPAPDSRELANTLERLRLQQVQREPPRAVPNPQRGGAPGGGVVAGIDNSRLSALDRGAIGDRLRECWTGDTGARDFASQTVRLVVTTDSAGTIRTADPAPSEGRRIGIARAFADRAVRAALDPACATLPLPREMLGANHTFEITFRP